VALYLLIDYFREAIAGPVQCVVVCNVDAMLVFIYVFLLLAVLKKGLHSMNETFERIYKTGAHMLCDCIQHLHSLHLA